MSRPKFDPVQCPISDIPLKLVASATENSIPIEFVPVISCLADIPQEFFQPAMSQLVEHPEYNSTLILRSEIVSDEQFSRTMDSKPSSCPDIVGYRPTRRVRRTLVPRRPGRDGPVQQDCTFYSVISASPDSQDNADILVDLVILTPVTQDGEDLPYYHPAVHHIAFRYLQDSKSVRMEVVPLSSSAQEARNPNSRLYRTCLALLDTCHRYMWGSSNDYQKRVHHDCIIPREVYQDFYLVMRERWKGMVNDWKEATDPRKHVFELTMCEKDIAIATYLMLLWKHMYASECDEKDSPGEPANEPWKTWPRPHAGFVDLGCGNGLLTHILRTEGYHGVGIDVRARTSWENYPKATQEALYVAGIDPCTDTPYLPTSFAISPAVKKMTSSSHRLSPFEERRPSRSARGPSPLSGRLAPSSTHEQGHAPKTSDNDLTCLSSSLSSLPLFSTMTDVPVFKEGQFLISNHADELTPWTPVLATIHQCSGFLNIPCCPWTFDRRFERGTEAKWDIPSGFSSREEFASSLNLGGRDNLKSSYSQYRIWLAGLTHFCGWEPRADVLRIPSTRSWALVGLSRDVDKERAAKVADLVQDIRRRGLFKIRVPEGKAGDH